MGYVHWTTFLNVVPYFVESAELYLRIAEITHSCRFSFKGRKEKMEMGFSIDFYIAFITFIILVSPVPHCGNGRRRHLVIIRMQVNRALRQIFVPTELDHLQEMPIMT